MRSTLFAIFAAGLVFGGGNTAWGEEKLSKNNVVDFFIKSADLGASRGICIGTEAECAAPTKPPSMDMLISFDLASDRLTEGAKQNLEVFLEALNDDRLAVAKFEVEGHTDASGSERYNDDLANRRASAVVAYLTDRGIKKDRLIPIGMGERAPRTNNPFDPENRRVEMRITLR